MDVSQVMLPQQILPIVVAIGRPHHAVNMLARRQLILREFSQIRRRLMIEFNQYHRAVDAVVKHAVRLRPSDPREVRLFVMPHHLVHLDLRMPVIHIADV